MRICSVCSLIFGCTDGVVQVDEVVGLFEFGKGKGTGGGQRRRGGERCISNGSAVQRSSGALVGVPSLPHALQISP